jgi:hypothetical protein
MMEWDLLAAKSREAGSSCITNNHKTWKLKTMLLLHLIASVIRHPGRLFWVSAQGLSQATIKVSTKASSHL